MNDSLTLDMIYHPTLAAAFERYQYLAFLISTTMSFLTVLIVLKKSTTEMSHYKYLILNQLFWSYLFDCHVTFWQPIILFPFFMCYSSGPAKYLSYQAQYPLCAIFIFILVGMIHSIYCSIGYRIISIYYNAPIFSIVINKKSFMKAFIISLAVTLLLGNCKWVNFSISFFIRLWLRLPICRCCT
jgi:hypothetical protein